MRSGTAQWNTQYFRPCQLMCTEGRSAIMVLITSRGYLVSGLQARKPIVRHGQSYRIPQQIPAFSHSHHWEGKCRKDDSPEESMQFNRGSRDFQSVWRKGNRIRRLRTQAVRSFTINCSSIHPSCRSQQRFVWLSYPNSPSLNCCAARNS